MQQESSSRVPDQSCENGITWGAGGLMEEIGRLVDSLSCESLGRYLAENPPSDFTIVTLGPEPLAIGEE